MGIIYEQGGISALLPLVDVQVNWVEGLEISVITEKVTFVLLFILYLFIIYYLFIYNYYIFLLSLWLVIWRLFIVLFTFPPF